MREKEERHQCWHCKSGRCDCLSCGVESPKGWVAGPCGFCVGRAEQAAMEAWYRKRGRDLDPRDITLWTLHRPHDGAKGWREFKPLVYFRQKTKRAKP